MAQGLHPNPKARHVTPLRRLMIQLNQASTKKDRLQQFCRELGVTYTDSDTIPVLQRRAALAVYDKAASTAEDPVGFGKHAARTYGEILEHEKSYVTWVIQTYQGRGMRPSLGSSGALAPGGEPQEVRDRCPDEQDRARSELAQLHRGGDDQRGVHHEGQPPAAGRSFEELCLIKERLSSSQLEQANQQIQQLMATVGQLQSEMKQMKSENEPRRKKVPSEASTMGSFEQVP